MTLGSQSAGPGGGAVRLVVDGDILLDGTLVADGACSWNGSTPGAGGSVWLTAATLAGGGLITADGGPVTNASGAYMGSGGGGRVAVHLAEGTSMGGVQAFARGGHPKGVYAPYGAAGTVYLRMAGIEHGLLRMNNEDRLRQASDLNSAMTLVSAHVTDAVVGDVEVVNKAKLSLGLDQNLTVFGSWTNGAYFAAATNSTATFAGAAQANIGGSSQFHNLVATNAGKTLTFQSGATTTVEGGLILGAVTALSSTPGQAWNLTLLSGATQAVWKVTVRDSDASGGRTVVNQRAQSGMDLGKNLNWSFQYIDGTILLVR